MCFSYSKAQRARAASFLMRQQYGQSYEMQARLAVVDDRKVIEAMGSTSKGDFVIWELTAKS
jgi:hypothetical protein